MDRNVGQGKEQQEGLARSPSVPGNEQDEAKKDERSVTGWGLNGKPQFKFL